MVLTGERRLPIDRAAAWKALNDPAILQASIPGCEAIEKTGENEYLLTVTAALGPVRSKFQGKLALEDVVAPESYTLRFEGQGGAAGFAKGSAKVVLAQDEGATTLRYAVTAQVGGRIAQVGNRLIDSAALKLADDFFAAFERAASGATAPAAAREKKVVPRTTFSSLQYVVIGVILVVLVASVAYTLR